MSTRPSRTRSLGAGASLVSAVVLALVAACSSNDPVAPPPGGDAGPKVDSGPATCPTPGQATPGPADTHCAGKPAQPVSVASCHTDAAASGDDAGVDEACAYGPTLYGQAGVDDDCKYKVSWTSDAICEGAGGVQFTLTLENAVDDSPVTGIADGIDIEAFIPIALDASCDDKSTHGTPGTATLRETTPGSGVYKGPVVFDAPGEWTVRFHIHEECDDLLEDSPHGHVAFRVTVP